MRAIGACTASASRFSAVVVDVLTFSPAPTFLPGAQLFWVHGLEENSAWTGNALHQLVQKPFLSYSRMAFRSASFGSGVGCKRSEILSFQLVLSITSSTVTPGWMVERNASPSSPKRSTHFVVITADGPPRGRPARLRHPAPSPFPGLVM